MIKLISKFFLFLTLAFSSSLVWSQNEESVKISLTIQTSHEEGTNLFDLEQAWAKSIQMLTNNEVMINLEPSGSVVLPHEMLESVKLSVLDGSVVPIVYHAEAEPAFALMGDMIGAWRSPESLSEFVSKDKGLNLLNELHDNEVVVIGALVSGMESIPSKVKIQSINDFKGVKMRTPPGLVTDIFKELGVKTVSLNFTEVKSSLESNIIQAADYSVFSTNHKIGLHESAKYPIYPGFHSMPLIEVIINKDKWSAISPDSQMVIIKSVNDLRKEMIGKLHEEDAKAVAEANTDSKIEIVTWSTEEVAKFQSIARKQWAKYAEKSEKSQLVYDTVVNYLGL